MAHPTRCSTLEEKLLPSQWDSNNFSPKNVTRLPDRVQVQQHDFTIRRIEVRWYRIRVRRIRPTCKVGSGVLIPVRFIGERDAVDLLNHDLLQAYNSIFLHWRIS